MQFKNREIGNNDFERERNRKWAQGEAGVSQRNHERITVCQNYSEKYNRKEEEGKDWRIMNKNQ